MKSFTFVWLLLLPFATNGCTNVEPDFIDKPLEGVTRFVEIPRVDYYEVAWISEEIIAFTYREKPDPANPRPPFQIGLYELNTQSWSELPLPIAPKNCIQVTISIGDLLRAPDGSLAYTLSCSSSHIGEGPFGILYLWDPLTDTFTQLQKYTGFSIGPVAFSPEMKVWIQESTIGAGMNNELYRVDSDGNMVRLFSDFQRVSSPSWSSNGNTIVFIGTDIQAVESDAPQTWGHIENLLLHPWDLYQMQSDGSDVKVLYHLIGRPYQIRWSWDEKTLYFAGRRPTAKEGIWALNLTTTKIIRKWPHNTYFDLSPDGGKIVIILEEEKDGIVQTYPAIYPLPEM